MARDEKLRRVARALANHTRADGADCASGCHAQFPVPGLRLRGLARDLQLPLTASEAESVARASDAVSTQRGGAWEVPATSLELLNPTWKQFERDMVEASRAPLGIPTEANVDAVLSKLVVVGEGGRLDVDEKPDKKADGVFGTLVVLLPGDFEGGEVIVDGRDNDKSEERKTMEANSPNGLAYAAFYRSSRYKATPVRRGCAAFLVYDLMTTTIHEVPRFATMELLRRTVSESLEDYFDMHPPSRRLQVSNDIWRSIHSFMAARHFVYVVEGDSFETLEGEEKIVAECLASFCDRSEGRYVLYHAEANYNRPWYDNSHSSVKFQLLQPWTKFGQSRSSNYPTISMNYTKEVAPIGGYWEDGDNVDMFALVVQPVAIEHRQWTKLDPRMAMARLCEMDRESSELVSWYARVVAQKRPWYDNTQKNFIYVLTIAVSLDDFGLFVALLRSIDAYVYELTYLGNAVRHFGWGRCLDTIVDVVCRLTCPNSRCNLVRSVLYPETDVRIISHLLDVLTDLPPWKGEIVPSGEFAMFQTPPEISPKNCQPILRLAYKVSVDKLSEVVAKANTKLLFNGIGSGIAALVSAEADHQPLLPVVRALYERMQPSVPSVRELDYSSTSLPIDCDKCRELWQFLSSTEKYELSLSVDDSAQLDHVNQVLASCIRYPGVVTVQAGGLSLFLEKEYVTETHADAVDACVRALAALLK